MGVNKSFDDKLKSFLGVDFITVETFRDFKSEKNFNKFMCLLLERENDKSQVEAAESIYDKVLMDMKNIPLTYYNKKYPSYDLTRILGEPFFVVFGGDKMGTTTLDINGIETMALVVGSEVFVHSENQNLYRFWTKFKPHIIHELIHLNDYKRIKNPPKSDLTSAHTYYNNPLEFNAYYLEIFHRIYDIMQDNRNDERKLLKDRKSFVEFVWGHVDKIVPGLRAALTDKMRFKWNKRIYQLFDEIRKEFDYA